MAVLKERLVKFNAFALTDILYIILGNILITSAYAFITVPHEIINGGVTSFSLILHNLLPVDITIITNIITIILLILCYFGLGKEYFYKSIVSSICYMGFFDLFHSFNFVLPVNKWIGMVIAAVCVGAGYYLCIHAKSSTVGFDVIALIVHERNESFSIAKMMRLINISVIAMGLLSYGWIAIILGILFTLIQTKVLDLLLNLDK